MKTFVFLQALLGILACKSPGEKSRNNSDELKQTPAKSALTSQNLSERYSETCSKFAADSSHYCNSEIIRLACETKQQRADRAIYHLIANSDSQFIQGNEVLRAIVAKYADDKLYAALQNCETNDKTAIPRVIGFTEWLAESIVADLPSYSRNRAELVTKLFYSNCKVAAELADIYLTVHSEDHPECLEVNEVKRALLDEKMKTQASCTGGLTILTRKLQKTTANEQRSLFAEILRSGFSAACSQNGREKTCDLIHTSTQFFLAHLGQEFPSPKGCNSAFQVQKNAGSIRAVERKSSSLAARWLVRDCCFCQTSYYRKNFQSENPDPLNDRLLGVVNSLTDLEPQSSPDSCQNSLVTGDESQQNSTAYYDYKNVTDCKTLSVIGLRCSFSPNELHKREWLEVEPSEVTILSPRIDSGRAPSFFDAL